MREGGYVQSVLILDFVSAVLTELILMLQEQTRFL